MKISELVKQLEKVKNICGDISVYSTGYYGDVEVDEIAVFTRGERGEFVDSEYTIRDHTKCVVFLPGSEP